MMFVDILIHIRWVNLVPKEFTGSKRISEFFHVALDWNLEYYLEAISLTTTEIVFSELSVF